MFRLGAVSDSHGVLGNIQRVALALTGCDAVAHLGDCTGDALALARLLDVPVYSVRGNCDFAPDAPEEIVLTLDGRKVLLCHGHKRMVKLSMTNLSYRAREAGAQLALYGHTHIADAENDGFTLYVNPGALMDGRFAVIEFRSSGLCPLLKTL